MLGSNPTENTFREPLISNPINEESALDTLRRKRAEKLRKDLREQEALRAGQRAPQSLYETTVQPKQSLREMIVGFPRMALKEIGGLIGWGAATFLTARAAWGLGRNVYINSIAKPAAILLVSSTFPGAIVPADLLAYAITSPDALSMAFTTLMMFNKGVPGKYFKDGADDFQKSWKKYWGIDKDAPEGLNNWSPASIKFQILDKTGDALSVIPGGVKLFAAVVSVRALSMLALRVLNRMPLIAPLSSVVADLYGAALFTAMTVLGKELPERVGKWGYQFGKARVEDAFDAGNYAVEKACDATNTTLTVVGNTASSVKDGLYNATSTAFSPFYRATRGQEAFPRSRTTVDSTTAGNTSTATAANDTPANPAASVERQSYSL